MNTLPNSLATTLRVLAMFGGVALVHTRPTTVSAVPPTGAVVVNATANGNIMISRPNRTSIPASVNQRMRSLDMIVVPAKSLSRATIKTLGPDLSVQLIGLSKRTAWRLPCEVSGSGFIAWGNGINRGCMPPGVVIRGNLERISAAPRESTMIASKNHGHFLPPDALARVSQLFKVCSATDELGGHAQTVVSLVFSNPCVKALDRCQQTASSPCMVVSDGEWTSNRSTAFALCGNSITRLRDKDALMAFLASLVGQSSNCVVQVLSPGDSLLMPDGGGRTAVAFENDGSGSVVSVIEGRIGVVSHASERWTSLSSRQTFVARRGEKQFTGDWLRESELCSTKEPYQTFPAEKATIGGTGVTAQLESRLDYPVADQSSFDSVHSQYCAGTDD